MHFSRLQISDPNQHAVTYTNELNNIVTIPDESVSSSSSSQQNLWQRLLPINIVSIKNT